MKYLIKLVIVPIIAGILLGLICYFNNIPGEYHRAALQVYILGLFAGGIS